jgi:hydroxyacylglutathione hydrolase
MTKITKLAYGGEFANCYVVGEEGKPCVIVDPATNRGGCLDAYIEKHHAGICMGILTTHGHFDHIGGLVDLKHLPTVFMSEDDFDCLSDPYLNGSESFDLPAPIIVKGIQPYAVDDEDEIRLGSYIFKVITTPFHTKGSVCYYFESEGVLFSGDTLFHLSVGRTDLPGGSERTKEESLRKLVKLPDATKVYPGHEGSTTIGNEKRYNPELQGL